MNSLQQRFVDALDKRAKSKGLELVVSQTYSNVGLFHFMRPGGFQETLTIPFDFQPGQVTLGWMFSKNETRDVFPDRPNKKFASFKSGEMDDAIDALVAAAADG